MHINLQETKASNLYNPRKAHALHLAFGHNLMDSFWSKNSCFTEFCIHFGRTYYS